MSIRPEHVEALHACIKDAEKRAKAAAALLGEYAELLDYHDAFLREKGIYDEYSEWLLKKMTAETAV